jgi:hypothetical protein
MPRACGICPNNITFQQCHPQLINFRNNKLNVNAAIIAKLRDFEIRGVARGLNLLVR